MRAIMAAAIAEQVPAWVTDGAAWEIDAANNRAWIDDRTYTALADAATAGEYTITRAHTNFTSAYARTVAGVLTPFAANTLRRTDNGILIEPSCANLFNRAQELNVSNWAVFAATVTANTVAAPDGTTTAETLTCTSTGGRVYQGTSVTIGATYTVSIYAKQGTHNQLYIEPAASGGGGQVLFNLANGTITSGSGGAITALADGWYLCSKTFTASSTGTADCRFGTNNATSLSIYLWGGQFQASVTSPSSLVSSAASGGTRAADALTLFPAAATYDITFTFDDASTQDIAGATITGSGYAVPTNLNRRYIKKITGVIPDVYVDSVAGSDSNSGRASDDAFQTIAAVNAILGNDMNVYLARGSEWREQLGALSGTQTNVTIQAYGSGALPILDGADVASSGGWAKTGGRTNVYDRTWAHDNETGQFVSLWEDAVRLRWVADIATCDSTPGSYYVATTAGASSAVYYHPTGSGDPASNGRVVEISKRSYGLVAGTSTTGWVIEDVHTKRQLHNDGSMVLWGIGTIARRCLVEDGTKHNMLISRNCMAVDCIAWKSDWADRTNTTAFVAYANSGVGYSARFTRCISKMELDKASAAVAGADGLDAFYAHTASSATKWDSITYEDCSAYATTTAFSAADVVNFHVSRCMGREAKINARANATAATITDMYSAGTASDTVTLESSYEHGAGNVTIDGLRSYGLIATAKGDIFINAAGTINVTNSVIYRPSGQAGYRMLLNAQRANVDSIVTSANNIFYGPSTGNAEGIRFASSSTASANNNVYHNTGLDFYVDGVTYSTFALYRAAWPAFDAASVSSDPLLVDPANGNFNIWGSSPAIALGAGLERPDITYTAIPSDGALAAM